MRIEYDTIFFTLRYNNTIYSLYTIYRFLQCFAYSLFILYTCLFSHMLDFIQFEYYEYLQWFIINIMLVIGIYQTSNFKIIHYSEVCECVGLTTRILYFIFFLFISFQEYAYNRYSCHHSKVKAREFSKARNGFFLSSLLFRQLEKKCIN